MDMDKLFEFKKSFFDRRNITTPNGKMLYSYQMKKYEYEELKNILTEYCKQYPIAYLLKDNMYGNVFFNAFVLYAAEWWKREYNGGIWSWNSIFSSISIRDEINPVSRSRAIERALKYWRYDNSQTSGKIYFGAIVANGGLPAKFLQTATRNASMVRVLNSVLQYATENDLSNNETELFVYVKNSLRKLPETLRKDEICELIAKLISTVIYLKNHYNLQKHNEPIAVLNRECPDWKEQFPLLLEDSSIEKLLIGFVEKASRTQKIDVRGRAPSVERVVDIDFDRKLVFSFEFPENNIDGMYFRKFFNFTNADGMEMLPPTFYVNNADDDNTTIMVVSAVLGLVNKYRIRYKFEDRVNICEEIIGFLSSADNKLSSDKIMLCSALDITKPMVFTAKDSKESGIYVLRANGSVGLSEKECFIAYNDKNDEYKKLSDIGDDYGNITVSGIELKFIKCTNDVELDDFNVKLNVPITNEKYLLQGNMLNYKISRYSAYKGVPKLLRVDSEGNRIEVSKKDVKYFYKDTQKEIKDIDSETGIIDIVYSREGYKKKYTVVVLPKDAAIELKESEITFKRFNCYRDIVPQNTPSHITIRPLGNDSFECKCEDTQYPDNLCFSLYWFAGGMATIKLPYPVSGVTIYDEKQRCITGKNIAFKHLLGKKIRIFDNTGDRSNYDYYMSVNNRKINEELRKHINISDTITEVKLIDYEDDIRNLLNCEGQEEGFVQVGMKKRGNDIGQLRVSRYDIKLEQSGCEVSIPQKYLGDFSNDQLENTKVYALPLFDEDAQPIELIQNNVEGIYTGIWQLTNIDIENKVFVVYSDKCSAIVLKPLIISQNLSNYTELRQDIITNTVTEINDYCNKEFWKDALWLLDNLHDNNVPLYIFNLWQYICSNDKLLCEFLFRIRLDKALLIKLKEEFSVIPATIPVKFWRSAIQKYSIDANNKEDDDERYLEKIRLFERIKLIVEMFPELEVNLYNIFLDFEPQFFYEKIELTPSLITSSLKTYMGLDASKLNNEIFDKQKFNELGEVKEMSWMKVLQVQNAISSWISTYFVYMYEKAKKLKTMKICEKYLFRNGTFDERVRDVINFPQICAFYAYFMNDCVSAKETSLIKLYIKEFLNFNSNYFVEVYKISSLIIHKLIENKELPDEEK